MSSIGHLFDRSSSSIYPLLARTDGIRPLDRRRSRLALTLAERKEISRGLKARLSLRAIARQLRRAPSTVSRAVRLPEAGVPAEAGSGLSKSAVSRRFKVLLRAKLDE